jgi:hypothetical protein
LDIRQSFMQIILFNPPFIPPSPRGMSHSLNTLRVYSINSLTSDTPSPRGMSHSLHTLRVYSINSLTSDTPSPRGMSHSLHTLRVYSVNSLTSDTPSPRGMSHSLHTLRVYSVNSLTSDTTSPRGMKSCPPLPKGGVSFSLRGIFCRLKRRTHILRDSGGCGKISSIHSEGL